MREIYVLLALLPPPPLPPVRWPTDGPPSANSIKFRTDFEKWNSSCSLINPGGTLLHSSVPFLSLPFCVSRSLWRVKRPGDGEGHLKTIGPSDTSRGIKRETPLCPLGERTAAGGGGADEKEEGDKRRRHNIWCGEINLHSLIILISRINTCQHLDPWVSSPGAVGPPSSSPFCYSMALN